MRKLKTLIFAFLLVGFIPAVALSDDMFAPVRKVYLNDGKVIECQMAWLDGARMICRKFGGNMTLPLQNVDFDKTFPKYKNADGEKVLLVHPGPRYQDENIVISNVRMVRGLESLGRNPCFIVFEILNRGDPCEVHVTVNALDSQGKFIASMGFSSDKRLDTAESAILKKRLDGQGAGLENQMISLKVSQVERGNVLDTLVNGNRAGYGPEGSEPDGGQKRAREQKIRLLKETFLRERPSSP